MSNLVTPQAIPAQVLKEATDKANELEKILAPYLTQLTQEERLSLAIASNKTYSFITKGQEFSQSNPQFLPSYTTTEQAKACIDSYNGIRQFLQVLNNLTSMVNDTTMVSSSESYGIILDYYRNAKQGARKNVKNGKEITKVLAARFPRKKKKKDPPTVETPKTSDGESQEMKAA